MCKQEHTRAYNILLKRLRDVASGKSVDDDIFDVADDIQFHHLQDEITEEEYYSLMEIAEDVLYECG